MYQELLFRPVAKIPADPMQNQSSLHILSSLFLS